MKVESYLEQLSLGFPGSSENTGRGPYPQPTKPTKPSSVSFGGGVPRRFPEIEAKAGTKGGTPRRGLFEDVKSVLRVFPGATFLGVREQNYKPVVEIGSTGQSLTKTGIPQ